MESKKGIKFLVNEKGNKTGVLIRVNVFEKLLDELENIKDIALVYEVTSKKMKTVPYEQVKKEMFGEGKKKYIGTTRLW